MVADTNDYLARTKRKGRKKFFEKQDSKLNKKKIKDKEVPCQERAGIEPATFGTAVRCYAVVSKWSPLFSSLVFWDWDIYLYH